MQMASEVDWEGIAKNFCVCAICLEYFTEQKQLTCLHRFCKGCLNALIQNAQGIFLCPECREEILVPADGVNGFRTDFHTRNLVKYVQIQRTLIRDELRTCYGCTNLLKTAAYCFKCNDFLCTNCYTLHMTNQTLKDHRQHTLSFDDAESRAVNMKKLASLRDVPRCQAHPDKLSDLCCETCKKVPICTSCTYGDHKGHKCFEITSFAKLERGRALLAMQQLENVKHCKLAVSPERIINDLNSYAQNKEKRLHKMFEDRAQNLMSDLSNFKERKRVMEANKECVKQTSFSALRDEMKKEIQQVRDKYEQLIREKGKEIDRDFESEEYLLKKELKKLSTELERLDKTKGDLEKSIAMQVSTQVKNIGEISLHYKNAKKRFENLTSMVSDLLESKNDWMAAVYTSDICSASDKLLEDIAGLPNLEKTNKFKIDLEQVTLLETVNKLISKGNAFSSKIEGNWLINDITGSHNVIVVTAEHVFKKLSVFFVVDHTGSVIRQDKITKKSTFHQHFCEFLSLFKVASVCQPNEIGIYDVRDGLYTGKDLSTISTWPSDRDVLSIATDPLNDTIFVGGNSTSVYVFDGMLNHLHVLELPSIATSVSNMTVFKSSLIICDKERQRTYDITVEKLQATNFSDLVNPDVGRVKLKPMSVCSDSDGLIYMLWTTDKLFGQNRHILAQYSQSNRRLIAKRQLDFEATFITTYETDEKEMLLVANTEFFYAYSLQDSVPDNNTQGTSRQDE